MRNVTLMEFMYLENVPVVEFMYLEDVPLMEFMYLEDVPLVEFMYPVFTRMPGESQCRKLWYFSDSCE